MTSRQHVIQLGWLRFGDAFLVISRLALEVAFFFLYFLFHALDTFCRAEYVGSVL